MAKLRTLYGTLFGALFFLLLATSEAEKGINQDFKSQEKRLNDDHFTHVYHHVYIKGKHETQVNKENCLKNILCSRYFKYLLHNIFFVLYRINTVFILLQICV